MKTTKKKSDKKSGPKAPKAQERVVKSNRKRPAFVGDEELEEFDGVMFDSDFVGFEENPYTDF